MDLKQSFYANLERAQQEIKEYEAIKKKLDSRRLDFDSKQNKLESAKRDAPELEEAVRIAETKFNDTLAECETKMRQVIEMQDTLVRDIAGFVAAHVQYYQTALDSMLQVQRDLDDLYVYLYVHCILTFM